MSARPCEAAFEDGAVIGFKNGETGPKELALRDDDDVEAWRNVIMTENLSYQSFSAVSLDRAAKFFRCRNAEPARRRLSGPDKQRVIPAMDSRAGLVNLLKIRVAPDSLARAESQAFNRC